MLPQHVCFCSVTYLQVRYGEGEIPVGKGSAADVHLPLEELRSVVALLSRGVEVHQPVGSVVAHSRGLTVPVDNLWTTITKSQ